MVALFTPKALRSEVELWTTDTYLNDDDDRAREWVEAGTPPC